MEDNSKKRAAVVRARRAAVVRVVRLVRLVRLVRRPVVR
jgi:hypothetical protein